VESGWIPGSGLDREIDLPIGFVWRGDLEDHRSRTPRAKKYRPRGVYRQRPGPIERQRLIGERLWLSVAPPKHRDDQRRRVVHPFRLTILRSVDPAGVSPPKGSDFLSTGSAFSLSALSSLELQTFAAYIHLDSPEERG